MVTLSVAGVIICMANMLEASFLHNVSMCGIQERFLSNIMAIDFVSSLICTSEMYDTSSERLPNAVCDILSLLTARSLLWQYWLAILRDILDVNAMLSVEFPLRIRVVICGKINLSGMSNVQG